MQRPRLDGTLMTRQLLAILQDDECWSTTYPEPLKQVGPLLCSNGPNTKCIVIAPSLQCVCEVAIELPAEPAPRRVKEDQ